MKNTQITRTAEPVSASTQGLAKPSDRLSLFKEDISTPNLSAETLPVFGRPAAGTQDGQGVLRIMGVADLTAAHGGRFGRQVRAALNGHTVIEIDLSRTTSMDCAGLGALIAVRNLAHDRNGVVRLVNSTSRVRQLLHLMRAEQFFEIVTTSS